MKFILPIVALVILVASCNKPTSPSYIEKNCCNSEVTQWVLAQSANDTGPASYFFLPQVFNPGSEEANRNFVSSEVGIANYKMEIRLKDDVVWLYDGPAPIFWDGYIATSQLPAQSGVYNYDLTATFTNGEVVTFTEQYFCLVREFASCPQDVTTCVLRSMFDINDTTAPTQYINEEALLTTGLYKKCND